jgi:hypothetical protein
MEDQLYSILTEENKEEWYIKIAHKYLVLHPYRRPESQIKILHQDLFGCEVK